MESFAQINSEESTQVERNVLKATNIYIEWMGIVTLFFHGALLQSNFTSI